MSAAMDHVITIDCAAVGDQAAHSVTGERMKVLEDGLTALEDARRIVDALACGLAEDDANLSENPQDLSKLLFTTLRMLERAQKLIQGASDAMFA